jgi:hypothetical protein
MLRLLLLSLAALAVADPCTTTVPANQPCRQFAVDYNTAACAQDPVAAVAAYQAYAQCLSSSSPTPSPTLSPTPSPIVSTYPQPGGNLACSEKWTVFINLWMRNLNWTDAWVAWLDCSNVGTPSPTPLPTPSPTSLPTPSPTSLPTPSPTPTPTPTPTPLHVVAVPPPSATTPAVSSYEMPTSMWAIAGIVLGGMVCLFGLCSIGCFPSPCGSPLSSKASTPRIVLNSAKAQRHPQPQSECDVPY